MKKIINVFITLIFLLVYIPNIEIFNISIYQILIWIFIINYFLKNKYTLDKKMIIFGIFIFFQMVLIYMYDNEKILLLNKMVPERWYILGGWKRFDYFLGKYEAIAQLVHITEGILIYFLIKKEFLKIDLKKIKKYLFVSILALLLIIFSKKNSSLVTGILLILFYNFPKFLIKISLIANLIISILIPYYPILIKYLYEIINFLLRKGSFYTLNMRILIWKDVFIKIIQENLFLGTNGIITSFPENIIWYILQPYGLVGIIIFIYIFYTKKANKKYYLLIGILILQGISYYGFIVPPISYTFFGLLGYYRNQNKKEEDN